MREIYLPLFKKFFHEELLKSRGELHLTQAKMLPAWKWIFALTWSWITKKALAAPLPWFCFFCSAARTRWLFSRSSASFWKKPGRKQRNAKQKGCEEIGLVLCC